MYVSLNCFLFFFVENECVGQSGDQLEGLKREEKRNRKLESLNLTCCVALLERVDGLRSRKTNPLRILAVAY